MATSFQYSTGNDDSNLAHLAIGQANGVVADGRHRRPIKNQLILNYTRAYDTWVGMVGISTGETTPSHDYWSEWESNENVAHGVEWVTPIVNLPDELMAKNSMAMSNTQVEEVIDYIMANR